jgi:hypothetical protein
LLNIINARPLIFSDHFDTHVSVLVQGPQYQHATAAVERRVAGQFADGRGHHKLVSPAKPNDLRQAMRFVNGVSNIAFLDDVYATLLVAKEKMEAIGGTLRQVNLWRSSDQEYRQRIFGCGDTSFKDPFPESFEEFEARSLGRMKAMRKVIESYDFGAKVTDTSSWHIQRKDCYKVSVDLEAQVGNVATKTFGVTMQIHFKSRSDEVEKVEVS